MSAVPSDLKFEEGPQKPKADPFELEIPREGGGALVGAVMFLVIDKWADEWVRKRSTKTP